MQSLTSLVRRADPGDRLAQVVRALLDSGLIVTTRDGAGRYVQLSATYGRELGIEDLDGRGSTVTAGFEHFDANGNVLRRMEHPSQVARITGEPQRLTLGGARSPHGREMWMINSYMPMGRDGDGWEVLTVGVPLPRSVFTPPTAASQEDGEPFRRELLDFALAVSGKRLPVEALVEAMRPAASSIADDPLSVALLTLQDGFMHVTPIVRHASAPPPPPMRLSGEAALRWQMTEPYYNPNMGEADVLGDRVVIEYPYSIRTYALFPMFDGCGARVAGVSVISPTPHALSPTQRCALEHLARLAGPVLVPPNECEDLAPVFRGDATV